MLPSLGMGTWHMGERREARAAEAAALRLGLDLGMDLVDTAEMYGEGGAEEVVAEALRGRPSRPFVVSKFYPHHAARRELLAACEASLGRLRLERIDLYLYHWRGRVPLAETVATLEELAARGRIGRWGVSNFAVADMEALFAVPGGERCAANQVLYHVGSRGIEFDLLPWCAGRGVEIMAYCPLGQGALLRHRALQALGKRLGATPAQVALAWLLARPGVCAIPKASSLAHVRENSASRGLTLDADALAALDRAFPPPRRKQPLAMT